MKHECSLSHSQQPNAFPYSEPDVSSPHARSLFP